MNRQTMLETRIQEQQNRWERLTAKLDRPYRQRDGETRVEERLRQDAIIAETEKERSEVERALSALEMRSPHPNPLPGGEGTLHSPQPKPLPLDVEISQSLHPKPLKLFYSYSHQDEALRERLEISLALLKRQGIIQAWHDRQIGAGDEWAKQISEHLENADIILLLVSPDFIASDYCWDIELACAMERQAADEACVIPVILREVDWQGAPFGKLQALPNNAKPITRWDDQDTAFADVARGIRKATERFLGVGRSRQASA
jgi:hypothetical protein